MAQNEIDKLFIIGGSSGSFDALLRILPHLKPLLAAAVLIVLHRKNAFDTALADVFASRTAIRVKEAEEKERIAPGYIYIAPADYHLLIEKTNSFSLDVSEKINYSRPSIDVSFETAAEAFGKKLTGILLSGSNMDGTYGLQAVRQYGGTTIAQHPDSAESPYMPQQAIVNKVADYIFKPEEIAAFINGEYPGL